MKFESLNDYLNDPFEEKGRHFRNGITQDDEVSYMEQFHTFLVSTGLSFVYYGYLVSNIVY